MLWSFTRGAQRRRLRNALLVQSAFATIVLGAGAADAQQASAGSQTEASPAVEPIIVTARKRQETLQNVPVAVEAFSGRELERYRAEDFSKIAQMATQVILVPTASGAGGQLNIRGLGSSAGDPGIDSSVTLNIDGMPINRGYAIQGGLLDVASVQVLKGPQALFFGKNSDAGVFSVETGNPTSTWHFTARTSYEFEAEEALGEAIVSGPINDQWGVRIALRARNSQGWLKDNSRALSAGPGSPYDMYIPGSVYNNEPFPSWPGAPQSRLGGQDEKIGRITLAYAPTSNFSAILKVTGDLYSDDGPSLAEEINCGPRGVPTTATVASAIQVVDPFQGCSDRPGVVTVGGVPPEIWRNEPEGAKKHDGNPYSENDSVLTSLALKYHSDLWDLTSNTGFYHYDYSRYDAFNAATFSSNDAWQREVQSTFSEEVRALSTFHSPVNIMVGAYYDNTVRTDGNFGKITLTALRTDPNGIVHAEDWDGLAHVHEATYSAFGQVIWNIVPTLEATAGARYTYVKQSADQQNTYTNPLLENLFGFIPFLKGTVAENPANLLLSYQNGSNVSPEATLTWRPTPQFTLYGAYKTGYKAGGFSTNTVIVASATGHTLTFGPESSSGFELGAKTTLFGGRVRGDLTLYRYDFDSLQVNSFNPVTISFTIQNAAAARTQGVELNADWAATNELSFRGAVGYNDARYLSFPNASCYAGQTAAHGCVNGQQSLRGQPLDLAPKVSANVGFSYERAIAPHWKIGVTSELRYNSAFAGGIPDEPNTTVPAQTFVDASVRLSSDDDRYQVALIGRDLANVIPIYGIGDKPSAIAGELTTQAVQGRYVTLEFTYHY